MRSDFSERYEVGTPACGVIAYFPSLAEVERVTGSWKERNEVIVFDRFARDDGVDARVWIGRHLVGCHRRGDPKAVWQAAAEMQRQYGTFEVEQEAVNTTAEEARA